MSSMVGMSPSGGSGRSGNKIAKGYELNQLSNWNPQQHQLFSQLMGNVGPDSFLNKLAQGDQSQFASIEQPALRQFGQLQAGLASRFSGMGGLGARHSSGFGNTLNAHAQDFAGQLQSQRMGLQQQAIRDLMGMSNQLLQQRPYENFLTQKQKPFWQELLTSLAPAASQFGGNFGTLGLINSLGWGK